MLAALELATSLLVLVLALGICDESVSAVDAALDDEEATGVDSVAEATDDVGDDDDDDDDDEPSSRHTATF